MLRYTLTASTFVALLFVAHGSRLAFAKSPQQVQQREAQERAERQRQAELQRELGERLEQQRRAQGLAEQQRNVEERIGRRQRDEQREAEESLARQRRARSLAEEQRETQEQEALLVRRRAQAEAERQRQIRPDAQVESAEQAAQPELSATPGRVLSPALLAFVGSCALAAISLFMLGRMVLQRFTQR